MKNTSIKSIQAKARKANKLSLVAKEIARNERYELLAEINSFVLEHWDVIWEGAERHPKANLYSADYWTDAYRIQFRGVRFSSGSIKIIDVGSMSSRGYYHCNRTHHSCLTDALLEHAVSVIQELVDSAATPITTRLKLVVE
jgi:hypothetical protein